MIKSNIAFDLDIFRRDVSFRFAALASFMNFLQILVPNPDTYNIILFIICFLDVCERIISGRRCCNITILRRRLCSICSYARLLVILYNVKASYDNKTGISSHGHRASHYNGNCTLLKYHRAHLVLDVVGFWGILTIP